jgi:outer membrane protein assembly factor BamB
MATPIVYGDYLYLCSNDGRLTCLTAKTGEEAYKVRLSEGLSQLENPPEDLGGRLSFVASPVAADGHLYFPAEDGHVLVIEAGPEFKMIAANPVGEYVLSTPAISEGVFYVRGQEHIFAFRAESE